MKASSSRSRTNERKNQAHKNVSSYRAQRRGGKGVIGMTTREAATEAEADDFIEHLFTASTHDYLMFFTNTEQRLC